MFAVLKTGGKQYRVATGDVLRVEKLAAMAGEKVQFNDVLMIGGDDLKVGSPLVDGAAVQADVIDQIKGEKLIHFVKRRRKHSSKRTKGHRQQLTLLRVTDILASGADSTGVKAAMGAGSIAASATEDTSGTAAPAAPGRSANGKADPKVADLGVPETASYADKIEAAVTAGTRPANLLDAPRGDKADDLKKISGLGPKLAGLLNENGVFHFDQIATWSDDEVAYMDDRLSFKGRIARDGWVDQAKTFAAEKE